MTQPSPIPDLEQTKSHTFLVSDDGTFPGNGTLPVILYQAPFSAGEKIHPEVIERCFEHNGWVNSWRNGLYEMHHYHSSAHEVLGLFCGWVKAQLGGPTGRIFTLRSGDVIILPAGVAHKNIDQSEDFCVIGAYPKGQAWDMNYGNQDERPQADMRIMQLPLPERDPLFGSEGLVLELWNS